MTHRPNHLDALDSLSRVEDMTARELAEDVGWDAREAHRILYPLVEDLAVEVDRTKGKGRMMSFRYRITGRGLAILQRKAQPGRYPKVR